MAGRQTSEVEAPLEAWRSTVRRTFTELTIDPLSTQGFAGGLVPHRHGSVETVEIDGAHQVVERSQTAIRRAPVDDLYFIVQRRGTGLFESADGGAALAVGDSVLHDMDRTHRLRFEGAFGQVCVEIPHAVAADRFGRLLDDQLGRVFIGGTGVGRVIAATRCRWPRPGRTGSRPT